MLFIVFALATAMGDEPFALENDRSVAHVLDDAFTATSNALSRGGCETPKTSPASEGCRFVRDEAYRFSEPLTTTKDFERLIAASGGMEAFRKKFGLYPPSEEQKRGPNASLPMGFTYGADKSHVHMNCFLCHGGDVGGKSVEGGANAKLRFEDMIHGFTETSFKGQAFTKLIGKTGFADVAGASPAVDMSLMVSGLRSGKTGDISLGRIPGTVLQNKLRPTTPVFAPPWWNNAPGLRRATFYTSGPTNQSAGHLMQFAMASNLTGAELRALIPAFDKVLACVKSKPPPKSPLRTDQALVNRGRQIYGGGASTDKTCNCASCHGGGAGTYREKPSPLSQIGTDGMLAKVYSYSDIDHHQKVLKTFDPSATVPAAGVKDLGYVAPPLVALFAKPALLHNHSVPTARELLCKSAADRAPVWSRKGEGSVFDDASVARSEGDGGGAAFDTRRPGLGNGGHDFCAKLKTDPGACDAMIEYLKTL